MATKTLKSACEEFVQHLRETGTASITADNYARILGLFVIHQGEDKEIGKILPMHVASFYKSEAATMKTLKDGSKQARAATSYLQIKRDVRLCLCWFHEMGWIEKVPIPAEERRFLEPQPGRSAKGRIVKAASGQDNVVPVVDSESNHTAEAEPASGTNVMEEPTGDAADTKCGMVL